MEKTKYKLLCPQCGQAFVGALSSAMDMARANVRCPNKVCMYVGKGAEFLSYYNGMRKKADTNATVIEHGNMEERGTEIEEPKAKTSDIGQIRLVSDGIIFPLHIGTNSFGRKCDTYKPNMTPENKIITDDMTMSRCHARIDVKRSPRGNGYVCYMQDTSLNGINLNEKEIPSNAVIILNYGDTMVWGETEVIFEASNGSHKDYNENICPTCEKKWLTRQGITAMLVCPKCGNSKNIIQKLKLV